MKLTIQQLLDSTAVGPKGLSMIGLLDANEDIPAKPSYWIGKVVKRALKELEYFSERRDKIRAKHETFPEGKTEPELTSEGTAAFVAELNELATEEIEFEGLNTISVESLAPAKIAPYVLRSLDWLIVE